MLSLNSIKRTHRATPQTPQDMLLNMFANLPPEFLVTLCSILFGFLLYQLRILHTDFREMQRDFLAFRSFMDGQRYAMANYEIRLDKLEKLFEVQTKELYDLKFQIQTK